MPSIIRAKSAFSYGLHTYLSGGWRNNFAARVDSAKAGERLRNPRVGLKSIAAQVARKAGGNGWRNRENACQSPLAVSCKLKDLTRNRVFHKVKQ